MSIALDTALTVLAYSFSALLLMGALNTLIVTIQDLRDLKKFW
jgi:hypothetical protein